MPKRSSSVLPDEDSPVARDRIYRAGFADFDDWYEASTTCIRKVAWNRRVRSSDIEDFTQSGLFNSWQWLIWRFNPTPNERAASRCSYLRGVITISLRLSRIEGFELLQLGENVEPGVVPGSQQERLAESKDTLQHVLRCVAKLDAPMQRELVQLWLATDLSIADLARSCGLQYHHAYALFNDGLSRLARCLRQGDGVGDTTTNQ